MCFLESGSVDHFSSRIKMSQFDKCDSLGTVRHDPTLNIVCTVCSWWWLCIDLVAKKSLLHISVLLMIAITALGKILLTFVRHAQLMKCCFEVVWIAAPGAETNLQGWCVVLVSLLAIARPVRIRVRFE